MRKEELKETVADAVAVVILTASAFILILFAFFSIIGIANFVLDRWDNYQDKQDAYMQEVIEDPKNEIIVNY